jgi:hypothetical protein
MKDWTVIVGFHDHLLGCRLRDVLKHIHVNTTNSRKSQSTQITVTVCIHVCSITSFYMVLIISSPSPPGPGTISWGPPTSAAACIANYM